MPDWQPSHRPALFKGFEQLGQKLPFTMERSMPVQKDSQAVIYIWIVPVLRSYRQILPMAACMAEGKTIIENPAKEPHIVDVANFLNSMGANIKALVRIPSVFVAWRVFTAANTLLYQNQIEAGTYMMAAAAAGGMSISRNVIPKHLEAITAKLIAKSV